MASEFKRNELEYCSLIAKLNVLNRDSLAWFASNISSKNFGHSKLWDHLQLFVLSRKLIKRKNNITNLIIALISIVIKKILMIPFFTGRKVALKSVDCIIFSHMNKNSWSAPMDYQDAYLPGLKGYLANHNLSSISVTQTSAGIKELFIIRKNFSSFWTQNKVLPIEFFIKIVDVFKAFFITLFAKVKIPSEVLWDKINIAPLLENEFSEEKYDGSIFGSIVIYFAVKRAMQDLNPGKVYWPWENHAWEKMLIKGVNDQSSSVVKVAYQHSTIPLYLLNHFTAKEDLALPFYPDRIVTTGEVPKEILASYGHFPENCLRAGCALRYQYLYDSILDDFFWKKPVSDKLRLGFPLSCYRDENVALTNFLQEVVRENTFEDFSIKFHPDLNRADYISEIKQIFPDASLLIEGQTVTEFLTQIDVLVYSDTSVCFEAVAMGIPVIYIDTGFGSLKDPMFNNDFMKWNISEPTEIKKIIDEILSISENDLIIQQKKAKDYIRKYFIKVSDETMSEFL
jgi:hypothetical protein